MFLFRPSTKAVLAAATAGLGLGLLAACAPDLGPAAKIRPAADYAAVRSFQAPAAAWPTQDWWIVYGDAQLNALIDEALKGAPDLRVAQARLTEARAEAEQAGAALLPSVGAKGSIQEGVVGLNIPGLPSQVKDFLPNSPEPLTQISANLDYQVDFFGKNRAAVAAASSTARAAAFELAAARLQISTAVASAYADLVRLTADRANAVEGARARDDTRGLVANRLKNGLENRAEYAQAAAGLSSSRAEIDQIDREIAITRHQIAALLGAGPDRGLDIIPSEGAVHRDLGLPPTLAADLIGRRPDVAAARLRVEAAAQRIKVAHAAFYPNVDLTGSFLALSLRPQDIVTHNVVLGEIGPAISLPIFEGGRLEGAYRGARGQYDEAVGSYDKAVAQAFRDAADAVSNQRGLQAQLVHAREAQASGEEGYRLAKLRYQGGLSPYLAVLTAETNVLIQRRAVTDLEAQTLAADIALVRALGGGFTDTTVSSREGPTHG
jgi:NodT family efflux transporter outer membrane factor (OMF) lipoprotein